MNPWTWTLLLVLGVALLPGCVDEENFPERLARAWCHYHVACDEYASVASCLDVERFDDPYIERALEAGRIGVDVDAARECIDAVKSLECRRDEDLWALHHRCARVWIGTVAPDEPCLRDEECAGENSRCGIPTNCSDSCCAGACRYLASELAIGERCIFDDECAAGSYCFASDGITASCTPLPEVGERCPRDRCADGLTCDEAEGVCRPPGEAGDPCLSGEECVSGLCELGRCFARVPEGGACSPHFRDRSCIDGTNVCIDDRCQPLAGPRESCGVDEDCVPYAYCLDGECRKRSRLNRQCHGLKLCLQGLACDTGRCVPPWTTYTPDPPAASCEIPVTLESNSTT